jgi:hypothetical protein
MYLKSLILVAALTSQALANKRYKYVLTFSVDGLHGSDVEKYVALRPKSTIAAMLANGYEYTNAYTSAPSDSFPSTLALAQEPLVFGTMTPTIVPITLHFYHGDKLLGLSWS